MSEKLEKQKIAANVEFAPIDAKDNWATQYSTVAFATSNGRIKLGRENGRQSVLMEREYLVKLHELQEIIRNKYLPLFVIEPPTPNSEVYDKGLIESEYLAVKRESQILFPGETAEYYT